MSLREINHLSKTTTSVCQNAIRTSCVKFSNNTKVFFVPGLWEISQEEIEATWLTEEDNANIRHEYLKTLKRMRTGRSVDGEKYSARGLEHMRTNDDIEQRKFNKASVQNAVLAEQRKQKLSKCHSPTEIAKQSMIHSNASRDSALRMGACDAIDVGVKTEEGHQRESGSSNQHLENKSAQTSQLNTLNKPSSQGDRLSKSDSFVNRVFSRLSRGLEGEADHTKMKIKETKSSSLLQQGICIERKTLVSKIA